MTFLRFIPSERHFRRLLNSADNTDMLTSRRDNFELFSVPNILCCIQRSLEPLFVLFLLVSVAANSLEIGYLIS
jgi:hypothetical protein